MKQCTVCKKWKDESEFYIRSKYNQTLRSECKKCSNMSSKRWYDSNKDYVKELTDNRRWENGGTPMDKNIECTMYLGVHIAENLWNVILTDSVLMNPANPGYDILFNDNIKIDIKASVLRIDDEYPCWSFNIQYNKIPDFFGLTAFDNRDNLNIQYMWLIPGYKINDKYRIRIYPKKINNWKKYLIISDEELAKLIKEKPLDILRSKQKLEKIEKILGKYIKETK